MHNDYWNHNTAYHPWLRTIAERHRGDVLDVGCGDGLLAQRLAPISQSVTAIEPDPAAVERARTRLAGVPNVTVSQDGFHEFNTGAQRFDLITFVATLHHMDLRTTLAKARSLLTPTGEIAVVGLTADKTPWDWALAVGRVVPCRIGSRLHNETRDIGVVVANPREGLGEIRRTVDEVLPGASIRRGLYYRYLLRWANR